MKNVDGWVVPDFDRKQLVKLLPSGICAEIGVAKAKFSLHILENNFPEKLYLIDSWESFDLGYSDANMVSQDEHNKRYTKVLKKLKSFSNIEIIRKRSTEALAIIPDDSLDWIYIDGDHSFNGCYRDLNSALLKIKKDGFICGHDYLAPGFFIDGFEVNEAVDLFVKENNLKSTILTNEPDFKSYVISMSTTAENLMFNRIKNYVKINQNNLDR